LFGLTSDLLGQEARLVIDLLNLLIYSHPPHLPLHKYQDDADWDQ
jgi:hypothetical protein